MLAASINRLEGPQTVRVVLPPGAIPTINSFTLGTCRVRTPREMIVYMQDMTDSSSYYVWVPVKINPVDLEEYGLCTYDIRRHNPGDTPQGRVIPMKEYRRIEGDDDARPSSVVAKLPFYSLCLREVEKRCETLCDLTRMEDVPPLGYPLSGTVVEYARNIRAGWDSRSFNRYRAGHDYGLLVHEAVEERHARRILDNEREENRS